MTGERRLGRGLDALLGTDEETVEAGGAQEIPLWQIELNPQQPRAEMDPDELQQLADSIRSAGVIQPVVVRPRDGRYELVVGERRVRAAKLAGRDSIPAIVRDVPDDRMLELALIENIQRADLNPIDRARGIHRMMTELDLTQEEAGRRLGFQRSTVANILRLLELAEELQAMVARGELSAGHARALLSVPNEGARMRLARRIVAEAMSVRQAERLAGRLASSPGVRRVHEPSPHLVRMEEALSRAMGTRVEIKKKRRGGKVVIHFRDNDDFERLYRELTAQDPSDFDE